MDPFEIKDPIGFIRRRRKMFFVGAPSAKACATQLREAAFAIGSTDVHTFQVGRWWVVGSSLDWLQHESLSPIDLFDRLVPLPAWGPNAARAEVLVSALSTDVSTWAPDGLRVVRGSAPPPIVIAGMTRSTWARSVAFLFDASLGQS